MSAGVGVWLDRKYINIVNKPKVFLSYASEDVDYAQRLYELLQNYGIEIWFDKNALLAGQNWKNEIYKAIEETDFFIALLSKNYNSKIGFVQSEIRVALELLDLRPPDRIFIIPVRLDAVETNYPRLAALQRVDLLDDWSLGIDQIICAIQTYPGYATELEEYKSKLENLTQKIRSLEYHVYDDLNISAELEKMDKLYTYLEESLKMKFSQEYDPLFDASKKQMKKVYRDIVEVLEIKEIEIKSKNLEIAKMREKDSLRKHEIDELQTQIRQLDEQIASLQLSEGVLQPVVNNEDVREWRIKWHRTLNQLQSIFFPSDLPVYR